MRVLGVISSFVCIVLVAATPAKALPQENSTSNKPQGSPRTSLVSALRFAQLMQDCLSDDMARRNSCRMYIMGAIENQGSDDFERRRPSRLCLPEGMGWNAAVDTVVYRLEKVYRTQPKLHQTPAGIGVQATVRDLFSCPHRAKIEIRPADFQEQGFLEKAMLPGGKDPIFVTPEALVTNRDIIAAHVRAEPDGFYVDIEFSNDAAPVLRTLSSIHAGRPIAIFMDGEIISAPIILGPLNGNRWSISTGKSESVAKATADALTP